MQLAMIGLGRMGGNMTERLLKGGHEVVVWDRSPDAVQASAALGAAGAADLRDLCTRLGTARVIWIMVPAGKPVDDTIELLVPLLARGDIGGLENGYCLMVGGTAEAVAHCEPVFRTLAPPGGFAHVGPSGAGHFVKMIHNGIEYAMLEAYAEGYEILSAKREFAWRIS